MIIGVALSKSSALMTKSCPRRGQLHLEKWTASCRLGWVGGIQSVRWASSMVFMRKGCAKVPDGSSVNQLAYHVGLPKPNLQSNIIGRDVPLA